MAAQGTVTARRYTLLRAAGDHRSWRHQTKRLPAQDQTTSDLNASPRHSFLEDGCLSTGLWSARYTSTTSGGETSEKVPPYTTCCSRRPPSTPCSTATTMATSPLRSS